VVVGAPIAPTPRLRKIACGTTNIPISAITTVSPLKSTARLEVAPARAIASSWSRPVLRSSSEARNDVVRLRSR
jgi:hypothetical protein